MIDAMTIKNDAPAVPLAMTLGSLLKWVLPIPLLVAAVGVLPTWLLAGWSGVSGQSVAVVAVLLVMIASGQMTVAAARAGSREAALTFLGASAVRLILTPLLVYGLQWMTALPAGAMAIWLVVTYLLCLTIESAWLVAALRREAMELTKSDKTSAGEAGEADEFGKTLKTESEH